MNDGAGEGISTVPTILLFAGLLARSLCMRKVLRTAIATQVLLVSLGLQANTVMVSEFQSSYCSPPDLNTSELNSLPWTPTNPATQYKKSAAHVYVGSQN
jgi:hypothetical protein